MSERVRYHFLRLAQIDVLLILASWLTIFNVHEADEWHGPAPEEEDSKEHDDDGGGANELPLLNWLQAKMQAQSIRDSTSQT